VYSPDADGWVCGGVVWVEIEVEDEDEIEDVGTWYDPGLVLGG